MNVAGKSWLVGSIVIVALGFYFLSPVKVKAAAPGDDAAAVKAGDEQKNAPAAADKKEEQGKAKPAPNDQPHKKHKTKHKPDRDDEKDDSRA